MLPHLLLHHVGDRQQEQDSGGKPILLARLDCDETEVERMHRAMGLVQQMTRVVRDEQLLHFITSFEAVDTCCEPVAFQLT